VDRQSRKRLERWLCVNAGYSRVLPVERGAAYYLARFGTGALRDAEWKVKVSSRPLFSTLQTGSLPRFSPFAIQHKNHVTDVQPGQTCDLSLPRLRRFRAVVSRHSLSEMAVIPGY
jgi:hypothetical protein